MTPVAGAKAEDLRDGARSDFVDAQSVRDELERNRDEPPGAFHQERIDERDLLAARQQPQHQPHLGDGGTWNAASQPATCRIRAARPLQHAVDPRLDFANGVGRRIRPAGELA